MRCIIATLASLVVVLVSPVASFAQCSPLSTSISTLGETAVHRGQLGAGERSRRSEPDARHAGGSDSDDREDLPQVFRR